MLSTSFTSIYKGKAARVSQQEKRWKKVECFDEEQRKILYLH